MTKKYRAKLSERFWSCVVPLRNGCWEWTGYKDDLGYGHMYVVDRLQLCHRVAWLLTTGRFPKHCACHKCDNPSCVRFDHLFDGTQQENLKDMIRKGRDRHVSIKGSQRPNAKLTERKVIEIKKALRRVNASQPDLAKKYGVTSSVISHIHTGRSWTHVHAG